MQVLSRLAKADQVDLFIADLVLREYDSKRTQEIESRFQSIQDNLLEIKKLLIKSRSEIGPIEEIESYIRSAQPEVIKSVSESTDKWIEKNKISVHGFSLDAMSALWCNYFSGEGAFRKPKHRDDIPDAAISLCILEHVAAGEDLVVICKDGQLKRHLSTIRGLSLCDELGEFIAKEDVQSILRHLDSREASVESIKLILESENFQRQVMDYISQEKSDLFYACWKDDEIEDYHRLPLPLAGGIRADGPIIDSIGDVQFGTVSCIEPKHFVIPLEFRANLPVSFAVTYLDWLQLPEYQRNRFEFDSMDGDGICEIAALVCARVQGQIVVCLLEDMTAELVDTHAGFIGHENCDLDVEYVGGRVSLLGET